MAKEKDKLKDIYQKIDRCLDELQSLKMQLIEAILDLPNQGSTTQDSQPNPPPPPPKP